MRVRVSPSAPTENFLNIDKFDFDLPEKLIAKTPSKERSHSRLLFAGDTLIDKKFNELTDHLDEGDLLVLNDTKVFNARLNAVKPTGARVEILIEKRLDEFNCLALTKSNRTLKENEIILLENISIQVVAKDGYLFRLRFSEGIDKVIQNYGTIPLPPYIDRDPDDNDYDRYQTIYADENKMRSTAAPTAGLHFDNDLINRIKNKGVKITSITLDIGLGTFKPIKTKDISKHQMHSERIYLSEESSDLIRETMETDSKIVSVGTTSLRCLEAIHQIFGEIRPYEGDTDIFIYPGFKFNVIDSLITNFHLPQTTLILLVSAFAGHETIKTAYQHAIANEYRFFSYGDAMFLNKNLDENV